MTKALLIDPNTQSISQVELDQGLESIQALIGQINIDSDEVGQDGDRLFFDEACFIRATAASKRFKLDTLPPVAGIGVVVGQQADGTLKDVLVSPETLQGRVRFS
jgi:hypothetical protein